MAFGDARIARLLSARYLLLGKDYQGMASNVPGWSLLTEPAGVTIYERSDSQPKGFIVHEILAAEDEEDSLRLMDNPDLDYTQTAVVQVVPATACRVSPGDQANDRVDLITYEPERVVFQVDAVSEGWLVLNDLYYPGWEASVSGKEAVIQPTNFGLRGVCIPAGKHEVIFQFKPVLFKYGAAFTGFGLLLLMVAIFFIVRDSLSITSTESSDPR